MPNDLSVVLTFVSAVLAAGLVVNAWRSLRFRCARRTAYLALTLLSVGLVLAMVLTYVTRELAAALASLALLLVIPFGDQALVRATGGPDPGLLIQYRLRSILGLLAGSPPAPDRVREARARYLDLEGLRDPRTAPVIAAMHDLLTLRFDTEPTTDDAVKGAYGRLKAEITELQTIVGSPPGGTRRKVGTDLGAVE